MKSLIKPSSIVCLSLTLGALSSHAADKTNNLDPAVLEKLQTIIQADEKHEQSIKDVIETFKKENLSIVGSDTYLETNYSNHAVLVSGVESVSTELKNVQNSFTKIIQELQSHLLDILVEESQNIDNLDNTTAQGIKQDKKLQAILTTSVTQQQKIVSWEQSLATLKIETANEEFQNIYNSLAIIIRKLKYVLQ